MVEKGLEHKSCEQWLRLAGVVWLGEENTQK